MMASTEQSDKYRTPFPDGGELRNMTKPVLKLRTATTLEKSAETVNQQFSHGRRRVVIVEKTSLSPRSVDPVLVQLDTENRKKLQRMTKEEPAVAPQALRPLKAKMPKAKNKNREKLKRAQKMAERIKRTQVAKERLQRLGPSVRSVLLGKEPFSRNDRAATIKENMKDKVAQLAKSLIDVPVTDFPKVSAAQEQCRWLGGLNTSDWSERDRRRLVFTQQVLRAFLAGKTPSTIEMPDGGFFRWPSTAVESARTADQVTLQAEEVGVLSSIGYRVGAKGVSRSKRQALLTWVYERELRLPLSARYLSEWGNPRTAQRLQKLANTIASLTRNMKRRVPGSSAVEDWEMDLAFLKAAYYVGRYSFTWPRDN